MEKHYCDICNDEIKPDELGGSLMRIIERFPVIPVPGALVGSPEKVGQMVQRQVRPEVKELCSKCQKHLWDLAEKRMEKFGKKGEGTPSKSILIKP